MSWKQPKTSCCNKWEDSLLCRKTCFDLDEAVQKTNKQQIQSLCFPFPERDREGDILVDWVWILTRFNILLSFWKSFASPFSFTDIIDKSELKAFFETNCSQIYFIFYESFMTLESNLKQKGKHSWKGWYFRTFELESSMCQRSGGDKFPVGVCCNGNTCSFE